MKTRDYNYSVVGSTWSAGPGIALLGVSGLRCLLSAASPCLPDHALFISIPPGWKPRGKPTSQQTECGPVTGLQRRLRQGSPSQVTCRIPIGALWGHQTWSGHLHDPDRCPVGTSESSSPRSENCFWCRPDEEGAQGQELEEKGDRGEWERDEEMHRKEDAGPELEEPGMRRREDAGPELKAEEEPNKAEPKDGYTRWPGEPKEEESGPNSYATLLEECG
ncbi:hypothetical protein NDU88_004671 [Pleurodeles waltl]|uniref:Uncharacterized protein n=1 Tax=Pleurodeles waltl TaxID=8319 RepID=A0AAV7L1M2_PLEWA|nr:hypothetical protein NDU88_004671 [Pleurodeles waltl]